MRFFILSDLHIQYPYDETSTSWVNHFCTFLRSNPFEDTWIFILGDIIDKGNDQAYIIAERIFSKLSMQFQDDRFHFVFLPGNHDYCDGNLNAYTSFTQRYQTSRIGYFNFSTQRVWNFEYEDVNFILADSVQDGNYRLPGCLDLEGIQQHFVPEKTNMLFLHHSLLFEDHYDHSGIVDQDATFHLLNNIGISFVFHSHTHTTRFHTLGENIHQYGIGSIRSGLSGELNENEQFLEVQVHGKHVEAVANWLWRGGIEQYNKTLLYPNQGSQYGSDSLISRKNYNTPENYLSRKVLPLEIANADDMTRYLSAEKEALLTDICLKHTHVLLIAEAGMGKTFELQHLAGCINSTNPYVYPILLSLNLYSDGSLLDYIHCSIPEYSTINPNSLVLILDGYDELEQPNHFLRSLSQFTMQFPGTHICISMRSNFLPTTSNAFRDYKVYKLLDLDNQAINAEITRKGVDLVAFVQECNEKGLNHLKSNPFFLEQMLTVFSTDGALPSPEKLLSRLVSIRLEKDSEKFEYTLAEPLQESQYNIELALCRLAYAMQLSNQATLNDPDFQYLLDIDNRKWIKFSSLTTHSINGHSFSHNIFKEYFSACCLSKLSIEHIIERVSIPGEKAINPNWFNTFGLLLQMNHDNKLIQWVFDVDQLILTRLESDIITDDLRYSILKSQLEKIILDNIWFRNEICDEEHLGAFVQSRQGLELLLSHIQKPAHFRSLYFCLKVMSGFTNLFNMDDVVRQILVDCYQSDSVRSYEKRIAIEALANLSLASPIITADLIHRFVGDNYLNERHGIYRYLLQANQVNECVDYLLTGIPYICFSYEDSHDYSSGEIYTLTDCLKALSTPTAIYSAIKWFSDVKHNPTDFYNVETVVASFLSKASTLYQNGEKELSDAVFQFFIEDHKHYSGRYLKECFKFFSECGLLSEVFIRLISQHSDFTLWMIDALLTEEPALFDLFEKKYWEGALPNSDIFRQYALWTRNRELFERAKASIYAKSGELLPEPKPTTNYEEKKKQDAQKYFDCLFDKAAFCDLLSQLLLFYDNDELTFEALKAQHLHRWDYPSGIYEMTLVLRRFSSEAKPVNQFPSMINWDHFFLNETTRMLKRESAKLCISAGQKEAMYQQYQKLGGLIDYHTVISEKSPGSFTYTWVFHWYMLYIKHLQFAPLESHYLGLVEVPYHFLPDIQSAEQKYDFLEKYIAVDILRQRICELLPHETRPSILADMFVGCIRYQIKSFTQEALCFCLNSEYAPYEQRVALDYLLSVLPTEQVWNQLENVENDEFYGYLISSIEPLRMLPFKEKVEQSLLTRYGTTHDHMLLQRLIVLNSQKGLNIYIQESTAQNAILDLQQGGIESITDSIGQIDDISLMPLLQDAVKMMCTDSFKDGSFHSLYGALMKAFCACSQKDEETVWNAVANLKHELSDNLNAVNFCSTLQNELKSAHRSALVPIFTMRDIKEIIAELD